MMQVAFDEKNCHSCNKIINREDKICIACGARNKQPKKSYVGLIAFLLCLFFGYLGFHKFYLGRTNMGFTFLCISIFCFLLTVFIKIREQN
ncbi:TM2 domain-containing protein [Borreliella lusitaniae]|uniref:TM2 domain-containing protein n=1 Tax=Borreliella lusitaniae TaxID=100177 RepID=A0ACD5GN18_9SPIR